MNKNLLLQIFTLLTLFFAGCKQSRNVAGAKSAYEEFIDDNSYHKLIKDKELYAATTEKIPVDSIQISGDTLHVYTAKIQACDADMLHLLWNGFFAKSLPPQADLKLLLTNDPSCKEIHRFHLTYNIASARLKEDSAKSNATLIRLFGLNHGVLYHY